MGIFLPVMRVKQRVAKPLAKMVVDTWKPVISATVTVAGNITMTCCSAYRNSFHVEGVTVPVYYAGDCSGERTAGIMEAVRGGYKAANEI